MNQTPHFSSKTRLWPSKPYSGPVLPVTKRGLMKVLQRGDLWAAVACTLHEVRDGGFAAVAVGSDVAEVQSGDFVVAAAARKVRHGDFVAAASGRIVCDAQHGDFVRVAAAHIAPEALREDSPAAAHIVREVEFRDFEITVDNLDHPSFSLSASATYQI